VVVVVVVVEFFCVLVVFLLCNLTGGGCRLRSRTGPFHSPPSRAMLLASYLAVRCLYVFLFTLFY